MRGPVVVLAIFLLAACTTHKEEFSSNLPSVNVGVVALDNGEPAIAASIASARLQRVPGSLPDMLLRGLAEANLGQTEAAAADFRAVLDNRPTSVQAALGLARLVMARDPAAAEAYLAPAVVRGDATAAVWNNLGVARDLQGHHADAQDAYRHAIAADPLMQAAQVNLARSLSLTRSVAPAGEILQ